MLYVQMKYNPYTVQTELSINNDNISNSADLLMPLQNKRIQVWIDDFFRKLAENYRESSISLEMHCTPQDATDVQNAIDLFHASPEGSKVSIEAKFSTNVQSVDQKITKLKKLVNDAQNGPFEEFKGSELQNRFNLALAPEFEVNVIATMSSGKSTVINSFIGQELMPAKNEACTATIAYIVDNDNMEIFQGCCKDKNDEIVADWQEVSKETLEEWNANAHISTLHLEGNIKSIEESDNAKLVLVDTPGPNNSRDSEHQRKTYAAIADKPLSMVIYVLNATQLNINDDATLLGDVANAMSKGGRQAQDRFIFLANKIDAFDPEKGESVESALKNVREYLAEKGITNPTIIPVSANLAKLLRMQKDGLKLTRSDLSFLANAVGLFVEEDEMNMLKHSKPCLSSDLYHQLKYKFDHAQTDEEKAEILSGIPIVEELLNEFLTKHALPTKIKDAVDSFDGVMQKAKGLEKLNEQLEKDSEELQAISRQLEAFNQSKERIEGAKVFREKVNNEKYELSPYTKKVYQVILQDSDRLIEANEDYFEEEVKPKQANKIIESCVKKVEHFNNEIEIRIINSINEEFIITLEQYRNEYKQYVEDLLNKEFPDNSQVELKEFQKQIFSLPSANNLINAYTEDREVCVGSYTVSTSKWWNPFSWGGSKTVNEYETQSFVDMPAIWINVRNAIDRTTRDNLENAKKQCEENAKEAINIILSAMDDIDNHWEKICEEIKIAANDKQVRQKSIEENTKKLKWYENFKQELQSILNI